MIIGYRIMLGDKARRDKLMTITAAECQMKNDEMLNNIISF